MFLPITLIDKYHPFASLDQSRHGFDSIPRSGVGGAGHFTCHLDENVDLKCQGASD